MEAEKKWRLQFSCGTYFTSTGYDSVSNIYVLLEEKKLYYENFHDIFSTEKASLNHE
jgi:hypothetical protein